MKANKKFNHNYVHSSSVKNQENMVFTVDSELFTWNPSLLSGLDNIATIKGNFSLIVLNHSLDNLESTDLNRFLCLWNKASFKIAVDGGSNMLFNLDKSLKPDLLSGDFDSIKKPVLQYFKDQGVETIETQDQNYTDFTKSLFLLKEKQSNGLKRDFIVALWQSAHRLDHLFGVISTLYKWSTIEPKCPIFLLDLKGSLSWLMLKGNHRVIRDAAVKWCSLVPFDGPAIVTSTGLAYNMTSTELSFSSLISTSNCFDDKYEKTSIKVDKSSILWSQGFR